MSYELPNYELPPSESGILMSPVPGAGMGVYRSAFNWMLGFSVLLLVLSSCGVSISLMAIALPTEDLTRSMTKQQVAEFEQMQPYMIWVAAGLTIIMLVPAVACLITSFFVRRGSSLAAGVGLALVLLLMLICLGFGLLQIIGVLLQGQLGGAILILILFGTPIVVGAMCVRRLFEATRVVASGNTARSFSTQSLDEPWNTGLR